jgi:hypothetical protein
MTKWAAVEARDADMVSREPTAEEVKVTQQLTDCATKAMMANQQLTSPSSQPYHGPRPIQVGNGTID